MKKLICPYCHQEARLVTGESIYPNTPSLHYKHFYLCEPCNAYVGCHGNTTQPMGRLANAHLRALKSQAHAAFDPIWRHGVLTRAQAYKWLSEQLCIPSRNTHIGLFNSELCRRTIEVSNIYRGNVPVSEESINWISKLRDQLSRA